MGNLGGWDFRDGFKFQVSRDCLGREVSQNSEWESKDVEEAKTRQSELILDGSLSSVGLWMKGSRGLIDRGIGDVAER